LQIGSRPIDNRIAAVVATMTTTAATAVRSRNALDAGFQITPNRADKTIDFLRRVVEVR